MVILVLKSLERYSNRGSLLHYLLAHMMYKI